MITGTDFLCNELKASRDSELGFFLAQLCNLLLRTNSLPLERYAFIDLQTLAWALSFVVSPRYCARL